MPRTTRCKLIIIRHEAWQKPGLLFSSLEVRTCKEAKDQVHGNVVDP